MVVAGEFTKNQEDLASLCDRGRSCSENNGLFDETNNPTLNVDLCGEIVADQTPGEGIKQVSTRLNSFSSI